jgi:F-type H+-transporting ATPase subunit delta
VPGGFALTNAESVTDVSAPEIVALDDLDEGAIKAGLADAQKAATSAADGSIEKATAQTEVMVYSAMARSIGVAV